MSIIPISSELWPEIVAIQAEVYQDIEPESLEVLQSKWRTSPESCFAYQQNGQVLAYLLAHAWNSSNLPKLDQALPLDCHGPILVLHDLAIAKAGSGQGLGKQMIAHLLTAITPLNYQEIRIVSIQNSSGFWQKQGFECVPEQDVTASYGASAIVMRRIL